METIAITELDQDTGDELEIRIPARFGVCPRCQGTGTHDHPAFANGITSDEWHGPDWDDESRANYMKGLYDVACSECKGERVVLVPFEEVFTKEHRAAWERHVETCQALAEDYESERHLRRMESGGF